MSTIIGMAEPKFVGGNIIATCPDCNAVSSFVPRTVDTDSGKETDISSLFLHFPHSYQGARYDGVLWLFVRCINCNRGGVAKIHFQNHFLSNVVEEFLPHAVDHAKLPTDVPEDLVKEFREAELDASFGAYRSGSALFRSVLEKTLNTNGYEEVTYTDTQGVQKKTKSLLHRIEAAADDGVITQAQKKHAHENIRVLGNDILHDDWREVLQPEFEEAHKYTQRILEDLYDERATVENVLTSKNRPFTKKP